ncbi:acyltransferase-domain-containing protein [Baffinella frigidus]|nr:acyltransferase-domain-containing protein [Cryptophyta sp. CCMP2293]
MVRAGEMLAELSSNLSLPTVRFMGWLMCKINRRLVNARVTGHADAEANCPRLLSARPVVLLPTHKSYLDFLLVSWVLFAFDLRVPHIAAGHDFLNMALIATLFRRSGAFFIPRKIFKDPLWTAVLSEYTSELVKQNQWIEFFIEGSRSRSGKP